MDEIMFSIVIPVYNTEIYIERCLGSVVMQHYDAYEVIVVNDGSTDGSEKVIKSFMAQHPDKRIKYLYQENGGLSIARNHGLLESVGKYIIWLDSDDALADGALENLSVAASENPDIIICRIASYSEKDSTITPCTYNFPTAGKINIGPAINILGKTKGFWYAAWCVVPNRETLVKHGLVFEPGIYHEDELWTPQAIINSESAAFLNECYYLNTSFRVGSIITKHNIKKEFDKIKVSKALYRRAENLNYQQGRFLRRRILILLYTIFSTFRNYSTDIGCNELKKQHREVMKEIYGKYRFGVYILFKLKNLL